MDDAAFHRFYEKTLAPPLSGLAAAGRRTTILTGAATGVVFTAATGLFARYSGFFGSTATGGRNWFGIVLIAACLAAAAGRFVFLRRRAAIHAAYRRRILSPVAALADSGLSYDPDRGISAELLGRSLFFDRSAGAADRFEDAGLFSGVHAGRRFCFTGIMAERSARHGCHIKKGILFGGLFLVLDAPFRRGYMVAAPRSAGLVPTILAERATEPTPPLLLPPPPGVHPDFDRWFSVFAHRGDGDGDDVFPIRETADLAMEVRDRFGVLPWISRVGTATCLAVPTGRNHLTPPPSGAPNEGLARTYYGDIAAMLDIVKFTARI